MHRLSPLLFALCTLLALVGCPQTEPDPDPDPAPYELLTSEACLACGGDCVLESFTVNDRSHVDGGVDHQDLPPVGGNHDPCWASYGVHEEEVADENWIHNLEHGAVVLLYNCPEGCEDEVAVLSSVSAAVAPSTVLVTSYPAMDVPFAAVSWGWRLLLGCADDPAAFSDFYAEHFDGAPESVTAGPSSQCTE
jgi:hypothetical protein